MGDGEAPAHGGVEPAAFHRPGPGFPLPKLPDRFEEWLRAPLPYASSDPRFEVRRADPSEYPAIYDLVDASFESKRHRALYDWLYRRNPLGRARCWIAVERASGKLVSHNADWPWPIARGPQALEGFQIGDAVTAPRWQRQGVAELLEEARQQHPFQKHRISLGWPNEKSVARMRKHGRGWKLMGPLREAVCRLEARGPLRGLRRPRALSASLRGAAHAVLGAEGRGLFGARSGIAVEELRRFDSAFDEVTGRHTAWDGFWCPHDSEFLNWRHLERPASQHVALCLSHRHDLAGYCVVKLEGPSALLMDFVAPLEQRILPAALIRRALAVAREAGCRQLRFFATPGWPHWPLLRACNFAERESNVFIMSSSNDRPQGQSLERWQCLPVDSDAL